MFKTCLGKSKVQKRPWDISTQYTSKDYIQKPKSTFNWRMEVAFKWQYSQDKEVLSKLQIACSRCYLNSKSDQQLISHI